MKPDTSRKAVERLIADIYDETEAGGFLRWCASSVAAYATTLRALLAERDAARAQLTDVLAENDALRFAANNVRAEIAAAYRAGAEAMRELAAADTDCGCASRADVLAALAKHGERRARRVCAHMDACLALQAAAIRALPLPEMGSSKRN